MERLPIVYIRGYAGPTSGIDREVDDPFYGFNRGATHVRVGGDGDPLFYQFEGPLLRLMVDEDYRLLVHGDQQRLLLDAAPGSVDPASLWVYRFYDQAATTFTAPPREGLLGRWFGRVHGAVTAEGFDIETAASGLYDLILLVLDRTGAEKAHVVAHSMGGLVARCMMQKVCLHASADGSPRRLARDIVAKLFTYGTPHGGIAFQFDALNRGEQELGPAGSDIFAPQKMYGYLTKDATFGDVPGKEEDWDPQRVPEDVFDVDDIFCLVGTDPTDYGAPRLVVGPRSDGLVQIDRAYVRGANRAYVHKSHSGTYGEVNSEEGYQNLRRFLFGRWRAQVDFRGLPRPSLDTWAVWQADMRLAVRGLPIVFSEQLAAHCCPIQLNEELGRTTDSTTDSVDNPVPLVRTFLLDPARLSPEGSTRHGGRARYTVTLRVFKIAEKGRTFSFRDHLEQVPEWADSLIVDVGPDEHGAGLHAWLPWNSEVLGVNDEFDPITTGLAPNLPPERRGPVQFQRDGDLLICEVDLPPAAKALEVLGPDARLSISIRDLDAPGDGPRPAPAVEASPTRGRSGGGR